MGPPEIDGVEHRYLDVRGIRMHVAEAGSGEDVVVLLHGWPQHWWMWRKVLGALTPQHRVLMPDNRGFGWSETPRKGCHPDAFAEDAIALLDELGIERAKLAGHDWGGFAAFIAAADHPDRVERAAAINVVAPWTAPNSVAAIAGSWRSWYAGVVAAPFAGRWFTRTRIPWFLRAPGRDHVFSDEEAEVFAERLRGRERVRASAQLYRAYQRILIDSLLRRGRYRRMRMTVPGLLLFGTDDFFLPTAWLKGARRGADDLTIELIEGCAHFSPEERPDLIGRRLATFLA